MNIQDLRPVSALSLGYGVKALAYGPPGSGKSPLFASAPRPVLCAVEPGMLSMRRFTNLPAWEAFTPERIDEFFNWLFGSAEARHFDTVGVDSVSQMAEIYLKRALGRNRDGRAAYGEMSREVMNWLDKLYYLPNKHAYLIAKEGTNEIGGVVRRRPFFPGQDLNIKVPHLYDEILHVAQVNVPNVGEVNAIRTAGTFDVLARDRSGRLNVFEPMDLSALFIKAMS